MTFDEYMLIREVIDQHIVKNSLLPTYQEDLRVAKMSLMFLYRERNDPCSKCSPKTD